ncbi:MAG TPA: hypothetical protein VD862_01300 [Candidatus Paceibacterota bacterium]|nr:hypothetical protein [Candidatus Paceibacterota bacterium]
MPFHDIRKGIKGRLGALKSASEFSVLVSAVVRTVCGNRAPAVRHVSYDRITKRVTLAAASPRASGILKSNLTVLRAALRNEGIDVREVVVR